MSTRKKLEELAKFALGGGTVEDLDATAPVCKKLVPKVIRKVEGEAPVSGETVKEVFWGCMLGQLNGESIDETVEKLKRKLERGEI